MRIKINEHEQNMAIEASQNANKIIKEAISEKGIASIVLATGTSQSKLLGELTKSKDIDWTKVVVFHLDEYIGIPAEHPASFRKYLKEHFLKKVGKVKECNEVIGDAPNAEQECNRISNIIEDFNIDLAFVGIGENGHLAFNDPPADFITENPYIIVELEQRCRQQQVNEGLFPTIEAVPKKAISMSVNQVMKSKNIICFVPDQRKAEAVRNCLEGAISELYPASILRKHTSTELYLDKNSSSLLKI